MAKARWGAIERRDEEARGAVEEEDGVRRCNIKGECLVQPEPLTFGHVLCGACPRHPWRGLHHHALCSGFNSLHKVGAPIERVQVEFLHRIVAAKMVIGVAAAGVGAQRVGDLHGATAGAGLLRRREVNK